MWEGSCPFSPCQASRGHSINFTESATVNFSYGLPRRTSTRTEIMLRHEGNHGNKNESNPGSTQASNASSFFSFLDECCDLKPARARTFVRLLSITFAALQL